MICVSLSTSLQIAGYALMREYGKQFRKVLHYICKQYVPRSVSSYSHADSFSRYSHANSFSRYSHTDSFSRYSHADSCTRLEIVALWHTACYIIVCVLRSFV